MLRINVTGHAALSETLSKRVEYALFSAAAPPSPRAFARRAPFPLHFRFQEGQRAL
jgi:hypothetical protein